MSKSMPQDNNRGRHLISSELLGGNKIVEILHNSDVYRLQLTRQNKLILTK